jgi:pyruvate dehydrogenase E1 component beta subunit
MTKTLTVPSTNGSAVRTEKLTMVQAINHALDEEMARDASIVLLGEDVGVDGGVFRVTQGLLQKYGPERVVDTPLTEAGIVGVGVGLAIGGLRPVCEIQFSGFMNYCFEQLQPHVSRFRQRTCSTQTVPMVLRAPSGGGIRALEHHSESEEAMYVHTPGLLVVMPSGPRNAYGLMKAALRANDPVIFFEPKAVYRAIKEDVVLGGEPLPIGRAEIAQAGTDVTVVTWGAMVKRTRDALADVKDVSVEIVDLLSLSPMDHDAIIASVRKTGRLVVVHEAPRTGGLAGEVFARVCEDAFYHLRAPMTRVAGWDVPFPLLAREAAYLPDKQRIAAAIRKVMAD